LGIQSREAFESGVKIPLGFSTQIEAELEFEISIANIEGENLESATLYLIDNYTNEVTNLSEGAYSFKSNKGTFHNRFTLQFVGEAILGSLDNPLKAILIFPNPTDGLLNIISPDEPITGVEVYDVRGRRIYETHFINNSYTANLESLETGIYFVRITTKIGQITKKIVKK
jgi:Secretion system C-terminal sorting domain